MADAAAAAAAARFAALDGEQVKAAVYGYAGDLADDRITPGDMAAIVAAAAPRLDGPQKASLEGLLRRKVDADCADEVVAPLRE